MSRMDEQKTEETSEGGDLTPKEGDVIAPETVEEPPPVSRNVITLNDTKAGMEGLDVDSINRIINEASKGSKFYEHKLKQQKEIDTRIQDMKTKLSTFSAAAIKHAEIEMNKYGDQLESSRDYTRFIVHIDMDAFYASVEMRDDPSLRDKPMAVGGNNMLSTSNYVARRFGVRAAMPGFIAKKLCPQLIIVPCNFDKYRAVSSQVQSILKQYDPDFSTISLDEAYLDITKYVAETGQDPEEVVREMRTKIFDDTQLTASAGIASNGFLAKICGDICKPNNQYYLPKTLEDETKFVEALPIRKVNGIGGVTEQMLRGLGIQTCKDIWDKRAIISLAFKPITAQWLIRVSKGYRESWNGHDDDSGRKSMSCERTFDRGTNNLNVLLGMLEKCSEDVASELQSREMKCKSVAIKIKTVEFQVKTRTHSLTNFTSSVSDIFNAAKHLLQSYLKDDPKLCLRLLGVRVSKWDRGKDAQSQDSNEPPCKQLRIDEAFAKVKSPKKKADVFICPICSECFPTERAVEVHVDLCLATNEELASNSSRSHSSNTHRAVGETTPKTFTCPICNNVIESLVQNTEIASSEHVNYCISLDEQPGVEQVESSDTWRLYHDRESTIPG